MLPDLSALDDAPPVLPTGFAYKLDVIDPEKHEEVCSICLDELKAGVAIPGRRGQDDTIVYDVEVT